MFRQRGGGVEEIYLSNNIIDLFIRNQNRVFYYFNEKHDKTYRERNSIPNHEGSKRLYDIHTEMLWILINICFGCHFLLSRRLNLSSFVSYHLPVLFLEGKWKDGISIEHLILFNNGLIYICKSTRKIYRVS